VKIAELGEFGLVELISKTINDSHVEKTESPQKLIIGIGDDCAAWHGDNSIQIATVDALVQDVHFTLDITSWADLGWKALAINLSDIAAMGGLPQFALVSLALPSDTEVNDVLLFYRNMIELANQHGVSIIGGDTDSASRISITVTLLGSMGSQNSLLTRSSAKPGDDIAVTGYLGNAAAGFKMLSGKLELDNDASTLLKQAFTRPVPRITEGRLLVKSGIKTVIDISDGLVSDLRHICKASGVGARLETGKIPVSSALKAGFGSEALNFALSGGEDYELLFTGRHDLIENIKQQTDCPITVIGEITVDNPGEITLVDGKDRIIKPDTAGWQHFISK
jgi:thiamine-monophosphate kinase